MRANRLAILSACAALAGVPFVATADDAKETTRLRRVTLDYAKCVVNANHAKASEAILATSNNQAVLAHYQQLLDSDCLDSATGSGFDMHFPNASYLNALADALVNADFATSGEASFANRLPLAQPVYSTPSQQAVALAKIKSDRKRKELQQKFDEQSVLGWISRYGECVVRQNPEAARYWLLTPPDTPEETSRIKALSPAFSDCLGEGSTKFNRVIMRGAVAINYYRLAMATVVPGAGSAH